MAPKTHRVPLLVAALAWACVACTAGGDEASIDRTALVGRWTNGAGAQLVFRSAHRMSGTGLHDAMLGGTSCPDSVSGKWSFFSPPDDHGTSIADASLTSGDSVALHITTPGSHCILSAQVHRDDHGFNLCLAEDPDSGCSEEELLRPVRERTRNR
ncbi:hypothetical protein ACFY93_10200 [Streptomyces sp. NPDC008313]|uniref:hypothetical protein n=1 Tax=Streptomyces sp. NPDC008313 TaxID=3364826 RepID=UPI0036E0CA94